MPSDRRLTEFFISQARKHKGRYQAAFLLMPVSALLAVGGPKFLQLAIDNGIETGRTGILVLFAMLFLAAMVARFVVEILQGIYVQTAGIRTLQEIRAALVDHISHLGKRIFERQPLGVFVSRATSDVETIGETLATGLISIVTDALTIVAIFAAMIYTNTRLGLFTLLLLPVIIFIVDWFRRRLRTLYDEIRTLNGHMSAQMNEAFSMMFEVKNFHLERKYEAEFSHTNNRYRDTSVKAISYDALVYSVIDGMYYVTVGLIILLVSLPAFTEVGISTGEVIMYLQYLALLFNPIKQMGSRFAVLQAAYAALNKINTTMELPLPIDDGRGSVGAGDIRLEDVTFAYSADGPPVIKNLDLAIPRGKSTAIVGPTGSGKTTLIRLLTRQYDTDSGVVRFGDTAIADLAREELKKAVALVPQDPEIFNASITFNVGLDLPHVTAEKVRDCCRKVMADGFIQRMPGGYDAELTNEGGNLSAGQRQLIALARALATDADILVFDESTASIDTATERLIQQALDYVVRHKTTIIIAHRLSTIRDASQIVVLKNGRIDDIGTHAELVARDGLYRTMYELQALDDPAPTA